MGQRGQHTNGNSGLSPFVSVRAREGILLLWCVETEKLWVVVLISVRGGGCANLEPLGSIGALRPACPCPFGH